VIRSIVGQLQPRCWTISVFGAQPFDLGTHRPRMGPANWALYPRPPCRENLQSFPLSRTGGVARDSRGRCLSWALSLIEPEKLVRTYLEA